MSHLTYDTPQPHLGAAKDSKNRINEAERKINVKGITLK